MHIAVAVFGIAMGAGIATIWSADLVRGTVDLSKCVFRARDASNDSLLWPHWLAEYSTAAVLMIGAVGLLAEEDWGAPVSLVGLGACAYTSINSLGWALAQPDRRSYSVPMLIGAIGSVASAVALVTA